MEVVQQAHLHLGADGERAIIEAVARDAKCSPRVIEYAVGRREDGVAIRELLGLRGHRLELLGCMRGRQLNELRRGFHRQQFIGVVKGSVGIGTGNLNDLEVVVCGVLSGGRMECL